METKSNALKHRQINSQFTTDSDVRAIRNSVLRTNPRASRPAPATRAFPIRQEDDEEEEYPTYRETRRRTTQNRELVEQPVYTGGDNSKTIASTREKRRVHWLVPVGLTMFILVLGWTFIGTMGASFWIAHFTSDNGPTHGSILTFTPKAGAQPEQIIGINNAGQVDVFLVPKTTNNIKLYTGINLVKTNFPQATTALVILSEGDFNLDGLPDIQVQILSDTFSSPFHKVTATYMLISDGKGDFKQTATIIA